MGHDNLTPNGKIIVVIATASILAVAILSGCISGGLFTEEFRETFSVSEGAMLSVSNLNGDIEVTTWKEDQVEVYALKGTSFGRSALEKMTIEVDTQDGIVVETKYDGTNIRTSVKFQIKVPAGVLVDTLFTSNGDISIQGVAGNASLDSSNGDLEIRDVEGYVQAKASNGDIDIRDTTGVLAARSTNGRIIVEVESLISNLTIESNNGDIDVYVPEGIDADLEMRTSNGRWKVHDDLEVKMKTSSDKRLEGTLGDGGHRLSILSSNGDLDLHKL